MIVSYCLFSRSSTPTARRPWVGIVSGYSVLRNSKNSSSTKGIIICASPLGSPMKPSIEQAMK
jgi:hypothetical protein